LRPPLAPALSVPFLPSIRDCYAILVSTRCCCHKSKNVRQSFCVNCYACLPMDMQRALYKRIGQGFQEAYAAARAWLFRADGLEGDLADG